MAKIKVLFATPATARDCRVAAPISSNESMRNTSPNPSTSRSNSGNSASGSLIAFGQTGPASYQYDLHLITGDPCGNPGANRVTVLFNDGFRHHFMPGLLRRITQIMTGGVVFFAASAGNK